MSLTFVVPVIFEHRLAPKVTIPTRRWSLVDGGGVWRLHSSRAVLDGHHDNVYANFQQYAGTCSVAACIGRHCIAHASCYKMQSYVMAYVHFILILMFVDRSIVRRSKERVETTPQNYRLLWLRSYRCHAVVPAIRGPFALFCFIFDSGVWKNAVTILARSKP